MTHNERIAVVKGLEFKEALCDMVNQFAYEGNNGDICTDGLSALENAFDVLGLKECCKRGELWEIHARVRKSLDAWEKYVESNDENEVNRE